MRWWAVAALAALSVVLASSLLREARPALREAPPLACPDLHVTPPTVSLDGLRASAWARSGPGISVVLAGASLTDTPTLVDAGEGELVVSATGLSSTSVRLSVTAFASLLIDAQTADGFLSVIILGARCLSCPRPVGAVEVADGPATPQALPRARLALSTGQWKEAALALSGATARERRTRTFKRLLASANAFGGHPSQAEAAVPQLVAQRRALQQVDELNRKPGP